MARGDETRQGSWWPDLHAWVSGHAIEHVDARTPGDGKLEVLGDAPGEYVRARS